MREDLLGEPFRMFDFTPVGAGIAVVGVTFLEEAFSASTDQSDSANSVLVELIVDTTEMVVRVGGDHGRDIRLGPRQEAPTLDG